MLRGTMRVEHEGGTVDAGAAYAIYGSSGPGLSATGNPIMHQGLSLLIENPPSAKGTEPGVEWDARGAIVSLEGEDEAEVAPETEAVHEATPDVASGALPEAVVLHAASPNPVRDHAILGFALTEVADVRLTAYDLLGRTAAVLAEGTHEAGEHEAAFDAAALPSGTYLVRLEAGGAVQAQRLTLMR